MPHELWCVSVAEYRSRRGKLNCITLHKWYILQSIRINCRWLSKFFALRYGRTMCKVFFLWMRDFSVVYEKRHQVSYIRYNRSNIYIYIHIYICIVNSPGLWFYASHDDVIKWKPFPRFWPLRGIHRWPMNSPHKTSDAEVWCFRWSALE